MSKLLRANFSRMLHDRIFWLLTAIMALLSIAMSAVYIDNIIRLGIAWVMDFNLITYVILAPVLNSVLVALFVGGDYSGGTLRNKIIAGHRRSHIYITNLIVCSFAGIAFGLAFVIPQSILGLLFGGQIQANIKTLLLYAGLGFALIVAFTALFVLIAMLCQNKSYTAAGCILLAFILIFLGIYITSALNEPEYLAGYSYTENGVTVEEPETKNPNYIDGTKRQVYELLQNFTPGGQVIIIDNMSADKPVILAVYDGIILLAATGFGMVIFRRKDLK